jgi:hypothetical protein
MEKIVKGWLIVDVQKGNMRTVKRIGKKPMKASEIAIELKLDIEVPEKPILKAEGKITLSKTQLANMMIEQLTDESENIIK